MIKSHIIRFFMAALLTSLFVGCGGSSEETTDQASLSAESTETLSNTKNPASDSPASATTSRDS